jgi:hypothetical protein
MAEYVYNNSLTIATSLLPFYANYKVSSRTNWAADAEARNLVSHNYMNWVASIYNYCHIELEKTQDNMGRYYNKNKKNLSIYIIRDLVRLNGKNLKTRRLSKKLDHKLYRLFRVVKVISLIVIRLILLPSWEIYNIFHFKMLELY